MAQEAPGITPQSATHDIRGLHGRWHQVEVTLRIDASLGVGPKAETALVRSQEIQRKVKQDIREGRMAVITQFNHDNTYSKEVLYTEQKRFPHYRALGVWSCDEATRRLVRNSSDAENPIRQETTILHLGSDDLVLQLVFDEDEYQGIVETIRLQRFVETSAFLPRP